MQYNVELKKMIVYYNQPCILHIPLPIRKFVAPVNIPPAILSFYLNYELPTNVKIIYNTIHTNNVLADLYTSCVRVVQEGCTTLWSAHLLSRSTLWKLLLRELGNEKRWNSHLLETVLTINNGNTREMSTCGPRRTKYSNSLQEFTIIAPSEILVIIVHRDDSIKPLQ